LGRDWIRDLRNGRPVLLLDSEDREGETDIVVHAPQVTPWHIRFMRKFGGGLICIALHPSLAEELGIPFLTEIFKSVAREYEVLNHLTPYDIPYDEKSSFSISINFRGTFTGISDRDRAMTIREFGKLCEKISLGLEGKESFGRNFRSPGHVPILRGAESLLDERRGHTELSIAMAEISKLSPVTAICEMLEPDGDGSLSPREAEKFSEKMGLKFLRGEEVVEEWFKRGRRIEEEESGAS